MIINLKSKKKDEIAELRKEISELRRDLEWFKYNYEKLVKEILK